jgi:hypothetical protein
MFCRHGLKIPKKKAGWEKRVSAEGPLRQAAASNDVWCEDGV